jgi:hypothetical protein
VLGGRREGGCRGVFLLSEQVHSAVQVGDKPTGSLDCVHCLDSLTRDTDDLIELATLGQDKPKLAV